MKNPIQPLYRDETNTVRFKTNKVVEHLLRTHPDLDISVIHSIPGFSDTDRVQFQMLIGSTLYSLGKMSFMDAQTWLQAEKFYSDDDPELLQIRQLQTTLKELQNKINELAPFMALMLGKHPSDLVGD